MTTVLETKDLVKEFGALRAVDSVSVTFDSGDVTSIIGPNGAGKTTFYNLLSGRLSPTSGSVKLKTSDGNGELRDITGLATHEIATLGLSRAFQINNLFEGLSVLDNVRTARLASDGRTTELTTVMRNDEKLRDRAWKVIEMTDLEEVAEEDVANLSHGDKRKVEIALALATDPKIVLLDEPTAGMNPNEAEQMVELVEDLDAQTEITFVVTEHDMDIVLSLADRIVVLHRGEVIADGTPKEIMDHDEVTAAYLGENT